MSKAWQPGLRGGRVPLLRIRPRPLPAWPVQSLGGSRDQDESPPPRLHPASALFPPRRSPGPLSPVASARHPPVVYSGVPGCPSSGVSPGSCWRCSIPARGSPCAAPQAATGKLATPPVNRTRADAPSYVSPGALLAPAWIPLLSFVYMRSGPARRQQLFLGFFENFVANRFPAFVRPFPQVDKEYEAW
jgi:hypothetical protein